MLRLAVLVAGLGLAVGYDDRYALRGADRGDAYGAGDGYGDGYGGGDGDAGGRGYGDQYSGDAANGGSGAASFDCRTKEVWSAAKTAHCCEVHKVGCPKVHCEMSDWGKWGECSLTCGGGVRVRERAQKTAPRHGGNACGASEETQSCNTSECPLTCPERFAKTARHYVDLWSRHAARNTEGHVAERSCQRDLKHDMLLHGCSTYTATEMAAACRAASCSVAYCSSRCCGFAHCGPNSQDVRCSHTPRDCLVRCSTCDVAMCERPDGTPRPVDCAVSDWGAWEACSKTCGAGVKQRKRSVVHAAKYGGKGCAAVTQSTACNAHVCGAAKPDGSSPDADGSKPDGSKPDGSKPDGSKPDGSKPDGSKPCCLAMTASCLACAANTTPALYCAKKPLTPGCDRTGKPGCPMPRCTAPQTGCHRVFNAEKDANGCLRFPCGTIQCKPTPEHKQACAALLKSTVAHATPADCYEAAKTALKPATCLYGVYEPADVHAACKAAVSSKPPAAAGASCHGHACCLAGTKYDAALGGCISACGGEPNTNFVNDYVDEQAYQWLEYDYGLGRESHEDAYYYGYDDHRNKHDLVHHRKVQHRSHDPEDTVRHAQKADGRMLAP